MKPSRRAIVALLGFAMCSLTCIAGCDGSAVVSISQGQLQTAVDKYFPLRSEDQTSQKLPLRVVLSAPQLTLNEGSDRLVVRTKVFAEPQVAATDEALPPALPFGPPPVPKPSILSKPFDGYVTVSASVTYKPEEGAFYLIDPRIDAIEPKELPAPLNESLRRLVGEAFKQLFATNAVYKLNDSDIKMKAVKMMLKSVFIQDGQLKMELGR